MKQYIIDELRPDEHQLLQDHLERHHGAAKFGSLYWIDLEKSLYSRQQADHIECQPFYMAVELTPTQVTCELLVRSKNRLRCSCIEYADVRQRNWMIEWIDGIFDELGLKT